MAARGSKPTATVSDELDRQLVAGALEKRRRGEEPTAPERAALRRWEREREEQRRWRFYESIPKKHWQQMAKCSPATINSHADRYEFPLRGSRISLSAIVRRLHEFLASGPKTDSTLLDTKELAAYLGVSEDTVTRCGREGLPVERPGRGRNPSLYDRQRVMAWLAARGRTGRRGRPSQEDLDDGVLSASEEFRVRSARQRARRDKLVADKLALELAEKKGQLVSRRAVASQQMAKVVVIRARLLRMAESLAPVLYEQAESEIEARLHEKIEAMCRDFGRGIHGVEPTRADVEAAARLLGIETSG